MNNEQTLQIVPPCFIHSVGNCPPIRFFNCNNLDFMKSVPDKYYDLAIVDPPYGIGADEKTVRMNLRAKKAHQKVMILDAKYGITKYHLKSILQN